MTTPLQPLAPLSPPSTAAANTYTDLNGLSALKNAPSTPEAVKAVSQQVEALFLQMMLKSMRDANAADGELDSNETGMYQDMFDKQVALTLSKRQDLGIARLFERQLASKVPQTQSSSVGSAAPAPAHTGALAAPGIHRDGRSADSGAGSGAGAVSSEQAAKFVNQVLPTISRAAKTLGVSPLGLLAQAALETGWGQRMPRTADGTPSLNMFGIKAGPGWNGARATADTVEFDGGIATQRRTAFRAYGSVDESVGDFARLLKDSPRYRDALAAGTDAQAYVHGIARSGYASDPNYGNKLNQILNGGTLRAALSVRVASL
jgi:flagellar protein FlgJ